MNELRDVEAQFVPLDSLNAYDGNAKQHDSDNIDAIAENLVISIADFLGVPFHPPLFPAEGTVRTQGGVLNVRRAPNTTSAVIGTLPNGRTVKIIGALNGWYAIEFKNTTGYVSAGNISRK